MTDGFFRPTRWAALAVLAMAAGAQAQPIPAGPGLGAEADTLTFEAGAAFARLRAPVIEPSVEARVLRPVAGLLPRDRYLVDGATGAFRLIQPFDTLTTLVVRYRRLPTVEPPPRLRVLAPEVAEADSVRGAPPRARGGESRVQTTGSITRGVVAGSNRDVSLTSGLRLDVNGELAPGVTVQGALTDTDTPIVPEGTTQTLSDFDRIFVRVDGPRFGAQLGDVDLALTPTEFAPLRRKVQGATLTYDLPRAGIVAGGSMQTAFSAVRGRFRSQDLVLLDGVQGPYRLEGDRGEPFVLVVPGSEQVYWDGERLARGRDYTVDYGTGEITFTAARLVTAERRATVDFEFSAGGYARTLSVADANVDLFERPTEAGGLTTLRFRVLREADSPGLGDALGLSDADLDLIAAAGSADAVVPGETRVPFEEESPFVLYTSRDTTLAGAVYRIFVPATAGADSVFRVRFSRVRAGEGSYRRAGQALNGILYEWVGPTGGDYVPFRVLPRPVSRTVLDLSAEAEVVPGVVAFGEIAGSLADANTLSALDSRDEGGAYRAGLRIAPRRLGPGNVSASLTRRQRDRRFQSLDRLRAIDYTRRWNLARAAAPFGAALDSLGEASTEARVAYAVAPQTAAVVEAGSVRLGGFDARRIRLEAAVSDEVLAGLPTVRYRLEAVGSDADSISFLGSGSFFQQIGSVSRVLGRVEPGLEVQYEEREQRGGALPLDTLLAPTYRFVAVKPGVTFRGPASQEAYVRVELRHESEPLAPAGTLRDLADASRSVGGEAGLLWTGTAGLRTDLQATYRRTTYRDAFRDLGRQDVESLALRGTLRARPLSRALDLRARYEALTERTPVLQEAYVLVGAEAGQFVWRDGDGEPRAGEPDGRQQVDEFFPETTPFEGTYLRTFVPSDELFPAIGVEGTLSLRLDGARLAEGMGVRWGRLVDARATVEVRERSTSRELVHVLLFDPRVLQQRGDGEELGTVDGRFRAEGEVSLFPRDPRRGFRLGADHLTSTRRLAAGAETRLVQSARAESRYGLGATVLSRLILRAERRRAVSDAFATRTFDLRGLTIEPSVTISPASGTSLTLGAVVSTRRDALASGSSPTGAFLLRVPTEARWATSSRLSLTARAELSVVTLRGGAGSGLALFELTDGRGAGTSGLGGVQATVGLTESIRANAVYDLRLPASARAIQTVRVSVSALF